MQDIFFNEDNMSSVQDLVSRKAVYAISAAGQFWGLCKQAFFQLF